MPYQYPQRDNPRSRVQSTGIQLYGTDSTMKIDYWNQHVSLKIYPKKDPNDASKGVYNYDVKTNLTLLPDAAVLLGMIIRDEIIPATKNNEPKHLGIQASKLSVIYVSNGIEEYGSVSPYIGLFCNIDENCKPTNVALFKFNPRRVFTKFDATSGSFDMEDRYIEDLSVMAEFLITAKDLLGATAHSIDWQHAMENERDRSFMASIGTKLGVQYAQPVNYVSHSQDPWADAAARNNNAANAESPSEPAPNTSSASMDDLSSLLGARIIKKVKGLKRNLLYGDKIKNKKIVFVS